jgi:NADH-quinone oxidoreductase subunit J
VRGATNLELVSKTLFTDLLLPFEVTSVLFMIAILGAVALATRGNGDSAANAERTEGK